VNQHTMHRTCSAVLAISVFAGATVAACSAAHGGQELQLLRKAVNGRFLVGAAIMSNSLDKPERAGLLAEQFDCITSENELKPGPVHPGPDTFKFEAGDRLVAFAKQHQMKVIGHTLCWHAQSPAWMFEGSDQKPLPREEALRNLENHIRTVMSHFQGRIHGWDVVNEGISDVSREYLRDTPAKRSIGDDFILKAFAFAAAADPSAELYYNEYGSESGPKHEKTIKLIRQIKAKGLRIDAVGIQGHWQLEQPSAKTIEDAILAYSKEGVKVMITELDINVLPGKENPYAAGLPDEVQAKLTRRYADLFGLFVKHSDKISRVTFWGLSDGVSWLNNWPTKGRTNYPLLFDRQLQPKPAYEAVIKILQAR